MILLKKKLEDGTYFEFDKILASGYHIKEDRDRTTLKFANGGRKQFLSDYVDVIINLDLAPFDLETTNLYLKNLTSGEYRYYSLEDKQYKDILMIVDSKPEITIENSFEDKAYMEDFSITLLKAGDV